MTDPASPNDSSFGLPSAAGGLVGHIGVCPKCGMLHTGACWPYSSVPTTYVLPPDLSQLSTLIAEMREMRIALERLISLVESWRGDGK